jgi:acyl-CoA thioester hydrolase
VFYLFKQTIIPRFSETDALGHINNTVLPVWFESARIDVFKVFDEDLNLQAWKLIIANLNVDFKKQIYYGQDVEIQTYIEKIGNSSFVIYQEAHQNGEIAAVGRCTMVHFDYDLQQAAPLPDAIRDKLVQHSREITC